MYALISRIIIAINIAIALSSLGLLGSEIVLQSLFTVLGISFSIAVSILISMDFSKIYNKQIRYSLRMKSRNILNLITWDFVCATISFVLGLFFIKKPSFQLPYNLSLNIVIFAIINILFSLFYELYNFNRIQKFKEELSDKIMDEEIKNQA